MSILYGFIVNRVESTRESESGAVVLAACQGPVENATVAITSVEDLQHRRWALQSINDLSLADYAASLGFDQNVVPPKIPQLDFGEQGHVSGNTGFNRKPFTRRKFAPIRRR